MRSAGGGGYAPNSKLEAGAIDPSSGLADLGRDHGRDKRLGNSFFLRESLASEQREIERSSDHTSPQRGSKIVIFAGFVTAGVSRGGIAATSHVSSKYRYEYATDAILRDARL